MSEKQWLQTFKDNVDRNYRIKPATKQDMTIEELNQRLHRFNLTNDWSLFDDVPPLLQVSCLYPHVSRRIEQGTDGKWKQVSDEEYAKDLVKLFGELDDKDLS